jgi:Flp pilus assembly pilin Flp
MKTVRTFLAAETGGSSIEYAIMAAGLGMALSVSLYIGGEMLNAKFEAIATALKRQYN